jgi:hypothetical protein
MLASLGAVSASIWYEVDVTSLVTGDGTYSLRISSTSTNGADYSSQEGANSPELVLTLGGTPVPTNTPTPGPSPTPTKTLTPSVTPVATNTPTPGPFSSATFVYDGDGKRVKSVFNSTVTTYFVGNYYEVTASTVTKYYYAGAQRIAMRTNSTLNYLLGDHLGSTSLTTSSTGTVISEIRYKAWGEARYASGTTSTKYQYTGQYSYASDFGLHFYNARWYDPYLNGKSWNYDKYCQGYHCGIDFGAEWGDSVYAGSYGRVYEEPGKGSGGYQVVIQSGEYFILYQALDGEFKVNKGDFVTPDTILAGVGNHAANEDAGNYHLHLEIMHYSTKANKWTWHGDLIANPLLYMNHTIYELLLGVVGSSPSNNVTFHDPEQQDPRLQPSPMHRGGTSLWE